MPTWDKASKWAAHTITKLFWLCESAKFARKEDSQHILHTVWLHFCRLESFSGYVVPLLWNIYFCMTYSSEFKSVQRFQRKLRLKMLTRTVESPRRANSLPVLYFSPKAFSADQLNKNFIISVTLSTAIKNLMF